MRHVQKRKSASHAHRHTIFLFYRTLSPRMAKSTPCETHSLNRISKRTGRKNEKVHAHVRRFETFASRRVLDTPRSDRKKNKGKGLRFLEGSEKIVLLLFVVRTLENCITSVVDAIFWLLLSSPCNQVPYLRRQTRRGKKFCVPVVYRREIEKIHTTTLVYSGQIGNLSV